MKDQDNGKPFPDTDTKTRGHRIEFDGSTGILIRKDSWTRVVPTKNAFFFQTCDGKTIKTYINGNLVKTDKA